MGGGARESGGPARLSDPAQQIEHPPLHGGAHMRTLLLLAYRAAPLAARDPEGKQPTCFQERASYAVGAGVMWGAAVRYTSARRSSRAGA